MNWDSGLGFSRWHQAKKLGLTQQALIGIASAPLAAAGRQVGRVGEVRCSTAGFEFYDRTALRDGGLADPLFFNVHARAAGGLQRPPGRRAHAGQRGPRGRRRARPRSAAPRPPALYAYDPDIGRLAVTTPALQHRDRGRQPARVPVRRDRPRAAVRRQAGDRGRRSAARRPRASARSCATSAVAACWPRRSAAARVDRSRDAAAADQGAAGRERAGVVLGRARVRRGVHGPARDRAR